MKNAFLSFILISFLCFEVSAFSYQPAQAPPPPPPPPGQAYPIMGGLDLQNRYLKLSLGSSYVADGDFGVDELTYNSTRYLPFSVATGIENGPFAVEFEFMATSNKIDTVNGTPESGSVSAVGLMGTVLLRGFVTPYNFIYGGVGLGSIYVDISDGFANSAYGSAFAIQGVLGTEFRPHSRMGFFAEYKLISALALEMENGADLTLFDYDYTNSSLNFGFRMYY